MTVEGPAREMTKWEYCVYRCWGRFWLARTIFSQRFWSEPFQEYPQTWYFMPRWKVLKLPLQWLCGLIGGHHLSKTEWGYGGGGKVDRWCRWCNKLIQVPVSEARFAFPTFREMRPDKWRDFPESEAHNGDR